MLNRFSRQAPKARKDGQQASADRVALRALYVLATALLLSMTTWFSASAVVDQLSAHWELRASGAAMLTIAVQAGFIIGALTIAATGLADRVPPRRLMLFGALGAGAANALLLAAETGAWAIALRVATGALLAAVYPSAMKVIATWFKKSRGMALGIMIGALTLGSATPHVVLGSGGLDWRLVIASTSVLTVAGGMIAEFLGQDGPYPFPRAAFQLRGALRSFRSRPVILSSIGYFGHMWELYAMWTWFSVYLSAVLIRQQVSEPAALAGLGTFLVIGVGAAGCWIGGILADRFGRAQIAALSMMVSGACALFIGFLTSAPVWVVLLVGAVWGFWVVADSAQFSALITELAEQQYVGSILTLQLAIGYLVTIPTIWLVPVIESSLGWGFAFLLLAAGPVVGVSSLASLRRYLDTVQRPSQRA